MIDCVVAGAGPAGLAASAALTDRGVEHEVLERGRGGESWRTQRWDSFRLNTPGFANHMLGEQAPDAYFTGAEVVQRLEKLAADCPVREGVRVAKLAPAGDGYLLQTGNGDIRALTVVVATGDENAPRLPALAKAFPDRVAQYHAADYRGPDLLPEGAVCSSWAAPSPAARLPMICWPAVGAWSWRPVRSVACRRRTAAATPAAGCSRPGSSTSDRKTCRTRR